MSCSKTVKLLRVLPLYLFLILVTINSPQLFASPAASIGINPNTIIGTEYVPCTDITVSILVENTSQVKVLSLSVNYDPQVVNYVGHILVPAKDIESVQFSVDNSIGLFNVNFSYKSSLTSEMAIQVANITFHVLKRGETCFNLTVNKFQDPSGNPIPYKLLNGYFSNLSPYDLNMDGKIDIQDVAVVASAFGSYPGHPRWNLKADVNGDSSVDIRDIIIVASFYGIY